MKKLSKERGQAMEKWKKKHGACEFDFKNKEINLTDGGIISINSRKVKRHKIVGYKKLPNGNVQVLFSKNKPIKDVEHYANIWFEDIDDIIKYFKDMKKMLNSLNYKTTLYKK